MICEMDTKNVKIINNKPENYLLFNDEVAEYFMNHK